MPGDMDLTELIELADDIVSSVTTLPDRLEQALEVTARHVKDDAQEAVSGRRYFGSAAHAINYDVESSPGVVEAEIGYDKSKPSGKLGNLVEFGAPNAPRMMNVRGKDGKWKTVPVPGGGKRPLPPGSELQTALQGNEADFERGIEIAVDDAMKEARL